jgi:very-short-patch-repair endonuclease
MKRKDIVGNARSLRKKMTEAEEVFWRHSRNKSYRGIKFRRQHPIGSFVLDFFWAEKKIAIEIDGGIHKRTDIRENDEDRTKILDEMGIRVIRFTNEQVINNIGNVLKEIILFAEHELPN